MPKLLLEKLSVENFLPEGWRTSVCKFALANTRDVTLVSSSVTSREKQKNTKILAKFISGDLIAKELPWLDFAYTNHFLQIIRSRLDLSALPAYDKLHGLSINVQIGTSMRYECHVESNPITGLLYATDHPKGSGGELVISNRTCAVGVDEIDFNCTIVYPKSGNLYIFSGLNNPHYVRNLLNKADRRIVIVMNYFNAQVSEKDRPLDLDKHLGIIA
jgi:hypothetical protein